MLDTFCESGDYNHARLEVSWITSTRGLLLRGYTGLKIGLTDSSEPLITFSLSRIELKIEKVSRIGAEKEKADGIIVLYPNRKLLDRQVRVFRRSSRDFVLSVQCTVAYHTQVHHAFRNNK